MLRILRALIVFAALMGGLGPAAAGVVITVDKSIQRLTVEVDGFTRYQWPVSTARWGYRTPNGTYRPERLERKWFSRKYDWSPMPYSIFFNGGYAIHGSYEVSRLGRPASHGCIRLHPNNAAILFGLVQEHRRDTVIVVTGDRPHAAPEVNYRARPQHGPDLSRRARPVWEDDSFEGLFAPNEYNAVERSARRRWDGLR